MSVKQPTQYRGILVAVTGLTPQVVTETLYCLTVKRQLAGEQPFVPAHIVLLTTGTSRKEAEQWLKGDAGWLRKFGKHYGATLGVKEDAFDKMTKVKQIVETDDVRQDADSEAAANGIFNAVRELVNEDPDNATAIVASIAGGRATMGYLLGYALTVFGRDQDRLTHVLVTEKDLEGASDFYFPYPRPKDNAIPGSSGERHYPGPESLELTDIPFNPLRRILLPKRFEKILSESRSVSDVVKLQREAAESEHKLVIQRPGGTNRKARITVSGFPLVAQPKQQKFYAWVARCRKYGKIIDLANVPDDVLVEYFWWDYGKRQSLNDFTNGTREMKKVWQALREEVPETSRTKSDDRKLIEIFVTEPQARIRARIVEALGNEALAPAYAVSRKDDKLCLAIDPDEIEFID